MKRILTSCLLLLLVACGDDDNDFRHARQLDSGTKEREPGVCKLADCPAPDMGIACCTPLAQCGFDPSGSGLNCVPNPGSSAAGVCKLDECPQPGIGSPCCTPYAACGFDPFASGLVCFGYPPSFPTIDAGAEVCDPFLCPQPVIGYPCCQGNGECGVDLFGVNVCTSTAIPDAGPVPEPMTTPPEDPSVDGQCPSFLGALGPVWGCCSAYGVCGTFESETCLLPVGTPLPLDPDSDAGLDGVLRCRPHD